MYWVDIVRYRRELYVVNIKMRAVRAVRLTVTTASIVEQQCLFSTLLSLVHNTY